MKSEKDAFVEKMMWLKEKSEREKLAKEREALKWDTTPMPAYYKNWDAIDVEEANRQIDNDESIKFDKTLNTKGA